MIVQGEYMNHWEGHGHEPDLLFSNDHHPLFMSILNPKNSHTCHGSKRKMVEN